MRLASPLLAVAALAAVSCSDATGSIKGGESLQGPPVDCTLTGPACSTWAHLYACYFGVGAKSAAGGCSSLSQCHGSASGTGATASGFVCGTNKDSCLAGMMMSTQPALLKPLIKSGTTTFSATYLSQVLHTANTTPGTNNNNMPVTTFGGPPSYGFTQADLACIAGWVAAGAQND